VYTGRDGLTCVRVYLFTFGRGVYESSGKHFVVHYVFLLIRMNLFLVTTQFSHNGLIEKSYICL